MIERCLLRGGLARLDLDLFALVANALALVGFGLAERSQLGGKLTNLLLIAALNHNVCGIRASDRQAGGNLANDLVRQPDAQLDALPSQAGLVADANNLQPFLIAVLYAEDHV